jgi:DNA repair exonuclease SbcCD ATPase subunit
MDIPVWLIEILRQFPFVVVFGFLYWYAEQRVRRQELRLEERYEKLREAAEEREEKLRAEARQDRDAEIARFFDAQRAVREANEKISAAKDQQIERLQAEVAKLAQRLEELSQPKL